MKRIFFCSCLFALSLLFLNGCVTSTTTTTNSATTTLTTTVPATTTTTTTTAIPTYLVIFVSSGGTSVGNLSDVSANSLITAPAAPTRTGYTFSGWYKEAGFVNVWNFSTDVVTANTTLYAKWSVNSYIVSFEENGGSEVSAVLADFGTALTAPTEPTKTGYTFNGWYKEAVLTNAWVFATDQVSADLTLYAKWTVNSYTISFVMDGGSEVTALSQDFATAVTAPADPTKTGYTFGGWYTEAELTTPYVFSTMPASNISLYAKWTKNQYTITFEPNGGSAVTAITQEFGSAVTAPAIPTKAGITFDGWFSDIALTTPYAFLVMPGENTTLYAKWTVKINFVVNGGPVMAPIAQEIGSVVNAPADPARTGYTFGGFFADVDLLTPYTFTVMPSQSVDVYVKWTVNQYTFTFESNGGSVVTAVTQDFGSVFNAPTAPTKAGITFDGWYSDIALTTAFIFSTMPAENLTLYAKWTVKINFVLNGGNAFLGIAQEAGTIVTAPAVDPTRGNGFLFNGYFADAALTTPYVFTTMPAASVDVYVAWKKPISTSEDLLYLINNGGVESFYLVNDIDMTGVTLTGGTKTFTGILDGKGFTIRNAVVSASVNKVGFLFKNVNKGAVIENITFADSIHNGGGSGEACAFITAYAQGGVTFENIKFVNVSVIHAGSYAGLLFGDTTSSTGTMNIHNITVINDNTHWVEGGSYSGGLAGRINHAITVDVENVYMVSKIVSTTQAGGFIFGRLNITGIVLNIDQVVVKGSVDSAKNVGVIAGTSVDGASIAININGLFVSACIMTSGTSKIDLIVGNTFAATVITVSNVYYNSTSTVLYTNATRTTTKTPTLGTAVSAAEVTETWFTGSNLNQTFFAWSNGEVVLNTGSAIVTETGFSIDTSGTNLVYIVGDTLDLTGLVIRATFSDSSSTVLDNSLYTVDFSAFNGSAIGTYPITVTYKSEPKTFDVTVVQVDHVLVQTLAMKTTYLISESLNTTGLVVKAILSDGSYLRLDPADYTLNSSAFNNAATGFYDLIVTYRTFTSVTFKVHVVANDYVLAMNTVKVIVSDDYTGVEGALSGEYNHFRTLKSALSFLGAIGLGAEIQKVIFVEAGTYYEKIEISIPNLMLIGADRDTTIITYDAASGLESPAGAPWGTQGSASVAIKSAAINFMCKNITIANGFDYNASTIGDKQGVALVNEADQAIYYNVKFLGWQDTLYAKKGRQYYFNCYIEGVVDFIFGNAGPAFFEGSTIHSLDRSTGCLTAQKGYNESASALATYGYVFYNNTFTAGTGVPAGSVDLGRPWDQYAKVAYISNTFGAHISARGWTEMSGILPTNPNVRFKEYQNEDTLGALLPTTTNGVVLTPEEAALYTDKTVVFAQVNGGIDFGSAWDFATDLTALSSMTMPS